MASTEPAEAAERDARLAAPGAADTRNRIRQVALELFADQGYDGTSLRQIAEKLDITKAALYYHFKSKAEIVESVLADMFDQVDELVAWAAEQPSTEQTRHEVLRRYSEIVGTSMSAMRFVAQASGAKESHPGEHFKSRVQGLSGVLTPAAPTLEQRGKAMLAVVAQHIGAAMGSGQHAIPLGLTDAKIDPVEARAVMLRIGMDLVRDSPYDA